MNSAKHSHVGFLKSAFSFYNPINSTQSVLGWIEEQNKKVQVKIKRIPFASLKLWEMDTSTGTLHHTSGKFFSIDGIRVKTNLGPVFEWEQPIINQPEIGLLGFITKEFNGVLHFLIQAKIEPGNINVVQLSPTLQATKSNYTRVHQGKAPQYFEYFQQVKPHRVLVDQLQSEQGARFLKKRNRNLIIKVEEDLPVYDNFIWLTLAQIKTLMRVDNLVNMDTRTVIAGIPYGEYDGDISELVSLFNSLQTIGSIESRFLISAIQNKGALNSFDDILSFITQKKSYYELDIQKVPLHQLSGWHIGDDEIHNDEKKYFKIIATEVEIANREVLQWTQPMVESAQEGICAFVCKEINGVVHFAVQTKLECGNFDIVELAPTVQCITGSYKTKVAAKIPFVQYVLTAPKESIIYDSLQSEEGGRFYHEQNRNMIVLAGDEVNLELPENYIWMTLHQLHTFIKFNNFLNIQARSLLAAISFKSEIEN